MAKKEQNLTVAWVDADPDFVYAFEQGIVFGLKAAQQAGWQPSGQWHGGGGASSELWTPDEWRAALVAAVLWVKIIKAEAAKAGK